MLLTCAPQTYMHYPDAKYPENRYTGGVTMVIKILGTGCPKCRKLEENTVAALKQTGIEAEIRKVTDVDEIMKYGVMMTPALVVNEDVKSFGKVLSVEKIREHIGA